ncbi:MAG: asparagine synthase (glutamine-hydrolyzing), partial [Ruminococcus sp.]
MCGICGMAGFAGDMREKRNVLIRMQNALEKRGPDDSGIFDEEKNCIMAHRRLAVIDPEKGKQPMTRTYMGESYTIVYNGELYNTKELRSELLTLGAVFETDCDTEVVLWGYIFLKEEFLLKCNGIFAFGIWEHTGKRLFLARDRMGVKPLFYAETDSGLAFSSDVNSLLENEEIPHEIDIKGLSEIILMAPGRTPGYGIFRTVRELKRAEYAVYDQNGLRKSIYWQLKAKPHTDNFRQTAECVRFLVEDAVKRQLVSDVPLGTFLSGGLDSSIISSVAASEYKKQGKVLDTFSLDYKSNDIYFKESRFQPTSD